MNETGTFIDVVAAAGSVLGETSAAPALAAHFRCIGVKHRRAAQ